MFDGNEIIIFNERVLVGYWLDMSGILSQRVKNAVKKMTFFPGDGKYFPLLKILKMTE